MRVGKQGSPRGVVAGFENPARERVASLLEFVSQCRLAVSVRSVRTMRVFCTFWIERMSDIRSLVSGAFHFSAQESALSGSLLPRRFNYSISASKSALKSQLSRKDRLCAFTQGPSYMELRSLTDSSQDGTVDLADSHALTSIASATQPTLIVLVTSTEVLGTLTANAIR